MIAVDTSALMAILLDEPRAQRCAEILEAELSVIASAGTIAEAMIVASGKSLVPLMSQLIDGLAIEVIPVTAASARRVGEAYLRWGKGLNPAKLNFGDCFAYEVAMEHGCPLLYVGSDFARTDVLSALSATELTSARPTS